jgi:hypothetical protein
LGPDYCGDVVTDYHVITPEVSELVMRVIDGQLIIVPPKPAPQPMSGDPTSDGARPAG